MPDTSSNPMLLAMIFTVAKYIKLSPKALVKGMEEEMKSSTYTAAVTSETIKAIEKKLKEMDKKIGKKKKK